MLIKCKECGHDVSDKAVSCPNCGYPIRFRNNKRVTKDFKRNPNKFGQIRKLSGNRRNPYAVYPPVTEYKENGTPVSRPAIGYYPTYQEAQIALVKYNENPFDLKKKDITFKAVYDLFWEEKFANGKIESNNTKGAYRTGISKLKSLWDKPIRDIVTSDMQIIIDGKDIPPSVVGSTITVCRKTFDFAMKNDIVNKDYAKYLINNSEYVAEKGVPFFEDELKILYENRDERAVKYIWYLILTGLRISEATKMEYNAEENYLIGGLKTKAGKKRIIPIHPFIQPYIDEGIYKLYTNRNTSGTKFKITLTELGVLTSTKGTVHTPHDCRHTFSWLCDKFGVDDVSKHLIIGHAMKDVDKDVYGHRKLEELEKEICKIDVISLLKNVTH